MNHLPTVLIADDDDGHVRNDERTRVLAVREEERDDLRPAAQHFELNLAIHIGSPGGVELIERFFGILSGRKSFATAGGLGC